MTGQGSGWTAWRDVPADKRLAEEQALEHLAEDGFVVTSRELSRDGPWRIEIFGEGDRPALHGNWTWDVLPEKDWVAENQRSFQPFQVGPFWVHPSHNAEGMPTGAIPLRIDAGMAFGTGTHATTRGCLQMLAKLNPAEVTHAVDVGCGSGILAIAMAKLWKRGVWGGDNDPQAVEVARENAELNGVGRLCQFAMSSDLQAPDLATRAPYDLIVANILAGPLVDLAGSFAAATRSGSRLLLSGLLSEQATFVTGAYFARGFGTEDSIVLESGGADWRTILLRKIRD
jgi:ribosomal protein L11 methyltransferase